MEECSLCWLKHKEPQELDDVMFPSYHEILEYYKNSKIAGMAF